MDRSNTDLRVVTGPAGLDVEGTLSAQELRNAWTPMSEASPAFTRDQFVAWLHVLGDLEDDPDFSEAAEEHAKLFYDQEYLRNGKKWARRPLDFYLGYLNTGWADIFFYDGFDRSFAAPVTPAVSQSRGGYFEQQNADAPSMSRQDTPSNVSSATMQHIKGLLQEPLTAQTQRSWTKTTTDVDLMHQSWTESTQD